MLIPCDRLVGGEIHFTALYRFSLDLPAGIPEWRKSFVFWVVNEHIAVGEEENARPPVLAGTVPARIPELVAYLKGDYCLAGARGQREKYAMFALQNRLHRAIDGDFLIVAG